MPNRIIKDSICGSEKLNSLSDFQFRLWVGLITYVDDYGRGDARPAMIKGSVFPLRERVTVKDIESALHALAGAGCVCLYNVGGKPYLYFPNWERHQRIQTKRPKYPSPEDADANHAGDPQSHGGSRWVTVSHGESPPESNPIQSESNPNPNPNTNAKTHAREDDGFEEFWNAYPKKSGDIRTAYMEYIGAVDSGVEPAALLEAAQELADADEDEVRFAPSAEKWLRNKGWLQKPTVKANKPGAGKKTELDDEEQEDLERLLQKHWGEPV